MQQFRIGLESRNDVSPRTNEAGLLKISERNLPVTKSHLQHFECEHNKKALCLHTAPSTPPSVLGLTATFVISKPTFNGKMELVESTHQDRQETKDVHQKHQDDVFFGQNRSGHVNERPTSEESQHRDDD